MFHILNGISYVISLLADILDRAVTWIVRGPILLIKFLWGNIPPVGPILALLIAAGLAIMLLACIPPIWDNIFGRSTVLDEDLRQWYHLNKGFDDYDVHMAKQNFGDGKIQNKEVTSLDYYNVEAILKFHTCKHPYKTYKITKKLPSFANKPFFGLLGLIMSMAYTIRFWTFWVLVMDMGMIGYLAFTG